MIRQDSDLDDEERDRLAAILAIAWDRPPGLTFAQEQRWMENRRIRSQRVRDAEERAGVVRCKCGTIAHLGPGKGPHKASAECPVCKRRWWVPKEKKR